MDGSHFDALVRRLAATVSRRGLLARLTPGLAATATLASVDGVAAKACPPCRKKMNGRCKRKRPNGAPCGNGGRCRNGGCDHNVCTLNCAGTGGEPQRCGPAGSGCQCVNIGDGVGACVRPPAASFSAEAACEEDQIFGIPCTTYVSSCWVPCV